VSLVGEWVVDTADARTVADLGNVLLRFGDDGGLVYTIRGQRTDQIIMLRYEVEGSTIITNQPSRPQVERTEFSLAGNILTLRFGGLPYRFIGAE
jgi:hypothetical protein